MWKEGILYPPQLSVWPVRPTHLNVEGGDLYPHQLSVLPRITHLDVEGGESLPLQVAAWPQRGDPQNQNSRDTSVCEGHDAPRPPEVTCGHNIECGYTPKLPQRHLEHRFASANALSGPPKRFSTIWRHSKSKLARHECL